MHEGKGEEEPTQTVLRKCRKYKKERERKSQFSEDLQTLLFGQLCLAALWESKIKDLKMSICLLKTFTSDYIKCDQSFFYMQVPEKRNFKLLMCQF